MKNWIRMISVLAAAVLMASVVVTPAAAAKERNDRGDRGRGAAPAPQAQYLDAEIRVIGGQPVLTVEGDAGRTSYEFPWPEVALVDGAEVALVRQGNYFLLPTADGVERVSIEDFEVAVVAGQLMLMTQVNPPFVIPIAVGAALKAAGVAITAASVRAAIALIAAGKVVTAVTVRAAIALQSAGLAVTAAGVFAARVLIRAGVPVTAANVRGVKAARTVFVAILVWAGHRAVDLTDAVIAEEMADWAGGECINIRCTTATADGEGGAVLCETHSRARGWQRVLALF